MSSYLLNFIKTSNPNDGKLPFWKRQTPVQNTIMEVGNNFGQIPLIFNGNLTKKVDFFERFWSTQLMS
jgi:hypothetical protein